MVEVEIVYIPAQHAPIRLLVKLPGGATVGDAIVNSGLQQQYPEVTDMVVGIFAKQVARTEILKTGDRVEIYRPLSMDPKDKRRQRAKSTHNPK